MVQEDAPMLFLWTLDSYSAMSTNVKNVMIIRSTSSPGPSSGGFSKNHPNKRTVAATCNRADGPYLGLLSKLVPSSYCRSLWSAPGDPIDMLLFTARNLSESAQNRTSMGLRSSPISTHSAVYHPRRSGGPGRKPGRPQRAASRYGDHKRLGAVLTHIGTRIGAIGDTVATDLVTPPDAAQQRFVSSFNCQYPSHILVHLSDYSMG